MAPAASLAPAFQREDKILCFHMDLLYEAKVLDYRVEDPNTKPPAYAYKVHYKGWKASWDEWTPESRCRKLTEENKELASSLKKEMEAQRRAAAGKPSLPMSSIKKRAFGSDLTGGSSARGSEDRSSAVPAQQPRGTKRGREFEGIDKEADYINRPSIRLYIPDSLKSILVDDWEKVTKENKLVPLPSEKPVNAFLYDYEQSEMSKRRPGSADADILEEICAGVREYFNKSLGRILLYRFERQQFYEIHKKLDAGHGDLGGKQLADVYGVEHLLRLFVSMPDLIAHTNMDSQSVSRLREELSKMTQWLSKHTEKYLTAEYEHAGSDYMENAKGSS